ncbi:MAG: isoamylase early set domain-containing protein [Candidatus Nanopelagicales bacterium]
MTFALPADVGAVSVVGTFNDWTPGTHTLVRRSNGTRSVRVEIDCDRIEFRYLADGGVWLDEPSAPARNGANAVLELVA